MAFPNFDGEYENQLNLARKLIMKIRDKSDRTVALKYVNILTSLKSSDPIVKRNRNIFFKYFLQVLENQLSIEAKQAIACTCPIENEETMSDPLKYLQKEVLNSGEKVTSHWSKDKKSYVAAKIIPGRGAILYMAVASDADGEWDIRAPPPKK
ncbi:hypothetical protein RUM43_006041 [Polyplax serrata]|uniref:Uncharacterized protein n=1 Tax=Polyplax serrata TaxID=468196 RepID=A0AAN8NRB1_POLSC